MKYVVIAICLLASVLILSWCQDERYVDHTQAVSLRVPLGLPPIPLSNTNPLTQAKIDLGRKLFMDRRLSRNNTMSCAMCHIPEQGLTSNMLMTPVGFEGRSGRRNAPTLFNVAYVTHLFHDGRESSLENQIWGPLLNIDEMANLSVSDVVGKINALPDYQNLFEVAFKGERPTKRTISVALASYERSLVSGNSQFDRWHFGQQENAMNSAQQAGFKIFSGKANCIACHSIGGQSALFSDGRFHNTGIGWARSVERNVAKHRVQIAPGVMVEVDHHVLQSVSEPQQKDMGRYEVTHDVADSWAYRTPSLRNIAMTGPYMHDGSLGTLEEVVAFYERGGIDNPYKDPLLKPLQLDAQEKHDLIAFLHALTGENIEK